MPKQLQPTIRVRLVLRRANETEGRCRRSGPAHGHAERIVENGVRDGLAAVRDSSRAAKGIPVIELGGTAGSLANTRRVNGAGILQNRACRRGSVRNDGAGSGAVGLADTQATPVVDERIGGRARVSDARHPV